MNHENRVADSQCGCLPTVSDSETDKFIYQVFSEGDDLYADMIQAINGAKLEIRFETFIFAADETGQSFADALIAAVARGVSVRLFVDWIGSLPFFSRKFRKNLVDGGVEFRWARPWLWRRPWAINKRDHRKLLIVDDMVAYVGGFNIHNECSAQNFGENRWRDTHLRSDSPAIVAQAVGLFDVFWRSGQDWLDEPTGTEVLLPNHTRRCKHRFRCLFHDNFRHAQQTIRLTTPYFVPDRKTQQELIAAANRGIEVSLLVPGKSNASYVQAAARAAYDQLLLAGVKIFEFQPRMIHAKTYVIDGKYATVGTANLDYRSIFHNFEINLFSSNKFLCRQLEELFAKDLALSREIDLTQWRQRPWLGRIQEFVGWTARKWL